MKHSSQVNSPVNSEANSHSGCGFLRTDIVRGVTTFLLLLLAVVLAGETGSAQTGYTGIFGGGPFYKNAAANITEIENSGFTEAIVWSVEVSSTGT